MNIPPFAFSIIPKARDLFKFYSELYEPKKQKIFDRAIKEVSLSRNILESDFKEFIETFDENKCNEVEIEIINYFYIILYKNILEDKELRPGLEAKMFRASETDHKEMTELLKAIYDKVDRVKAEIIPHQIPPPPSDFMGRDKDLDEIMKNFGQGVTITGLRGIGGIGKTVLAYKLAEELREHYPDGQLMVDLLGTSAKPLTPAEAMAKVIHAYDLTSDLPKNETDLIGLYQTVLANKRILLLLDNAENSQQVKKLLPPTTCGVLITSRRMFMLPGLSAKDLNTLEPSEACDLLHAISKRIANHADELAKLCGYLPFALRAAGSLIACTPDLNLMKYIEELRNERTRLECLGTEGVDLSLEASFNLSYDRLSADTARVFRLLSVFPADFDGKAEESVCLDYGHKQLSELVRWSLVEYQPGLGEQEGRYKLHDLTRCFSLDRHEKEDGIAARLSAQVRHAEYYKNVLTTASVLYEQGGLSTQAGLEMFDQEWMNIKAGQAWSERIIMDYQNEKTKFAGICPEYEPALHLTNAYPERGSYLLVLRQPPLERIHWLEIALMVARQLKDRRMEALHLGNIGLTHAALGNTKQAIELNEQALEISREINDRWEEAKFLGNLAKAYKNLGDIRPSKELNEQALIINREIHDRRGEANNLDHIGGAYNKLGDARRAIGFSEQALAINRDIEYIRGEAYNLGNLAAYHKNLGDIRRAIEFSDQALLAFKKIRDRRGEAGTLGNLGGAYKNLKDFSRAKEFNEKALMIYRDIGDRRGIANTLGNLGGVNKDLGDIRKSIDFYEQALAISREIEDKRGETIALGNLGDAYNRLGDARRALEFSELALKLCYEICDERRKGIVLWNMSKSLYKLGERSNAIEYAESALKILKQVRSPIASTVQRNLAKWQKQGRRH